MQGAISKEIAPAFYPFRPYLKDLTTGRIKLFLRAFIFINQENLILHSGAGQNLFVLFQLLVAVYIRIILDG
jgi:hypothetical protein